ncbi:unnamed protein product [Thlaspi arvense]|uniref:DNA replication licensing factor MCM2 n=1 Tax=Thlaspi arvense TaxID=13288 RepID=A0AAU9RB65_THLAR|nr:unnamed protein product [Thlaspi arvense]
MRFSSSIENRTQSKTNSENFSDEEEAEVDPQIIRDEPDEPEDEEEDGEDLYHDNFMEDYGGRGEQDHYEPAGLDDSVDDDRDLGQKADDRRAAEAVIEAREGRLANRKLPHLLHDNDSDDWNYRPSKRSRTTVPPRGGGGGDPDGNPSSPGTSQPDISMTDQTDDYQDEDDNDDEAEFEMYRIQGSLREWVMRDEVRRFIAKKFKDFLLTYVKPNSENGEYVRLINEMVSANKCSLEIDYKEFIHVHPNIAIWLADAPQPVLEVMEEVSENVIFDLHPNYKNIHQKIYVRVTNLPVNDQIRNIRNYQKLTIQESPGTVPAGRLPRHKEVILLNDLIDCARPGEEIEVTGIYTNNFDQSLNTKNGFPVFATVVEANYVTKKQDLFSAYKLTQEDKTQIEELSKDPRIVERIIKSIAPSIYGHEDIKTAIALAMFGGQEKNIRGKHRLRGDINVLLLGDPGTAKSQFLKYVEKTGQRAVYTTGKGASAVGLTAAVHKDPVTREWTLEGGALVLADRGICLIDEFDKMNDQDRVSIHEAMEQQSISISKAGIVTSLQARCSVIAAANPVGGRYDSSKSFAQNVELTDPILSRFDILCVVKDVVDPVTDEMLAEFVVNSHFKSQPKGGKMDDSETQDGVQGSSGSSDPEVLPQNLLKKYLTYAKLYVFPKLSEIDAKKLETVYANLRRESMNGQGVSIATRHLESMIRMSESHARMHLRQYVTEEDVNMAIRVLLDSFISTQKFGAQRTLRESFKRYITYKKDFNSLLLVLLKELVKNALKFEEIVSGSNSGLPSIEVKIEELQTKANEYDIADLRPFFSSTDFAKAHFELDHGRGIIKCPRRLVTW